MLDRLHLLSGLGKTFGEVGGIGWGEECLGFLPEAATPLEDGQMIVDGEQGKPESVSLCLCKGIAKEPWCCINYRSAGQRSPFKCPWTCLRADVCCR